jgi:hypothetical protein
MTEDMQVRNLALNTQTSYVQQVSLFARHFNKSPEQLGPEDIRTYQVYLTNEKKLAPGSVRFRCENLPRRSDKVSCADHSVESLQVATLSGRHHPVVCALVSSLPDFGGADGRDDRG